MPSLDPRRWLEGYYLVTPLFVAADWIFGANVRAAGLADWPLLRAAYYVACGGCFCLAHFRPGWALAVGIAESSFNLLLLVLAVFLPYYALIESVSQSGTGANPFTPAFVTNLLIASSAWCLSYYGTMPGQFRRFLN